MTIRRIPQYPVPKFKDIDEAQKWADELVYALQQDGVLRVRDIQTEIANHNHAASDINSETLEHERGGLEADVSAYDGLVKISSGSTSNLALPLIHENGGLEADISSYDGLVKISGGATSAITDASANWNTAFGWGDHSGAGYAVSGGAEHDGFSDFVANEHIDWTNATSNFETTGTVVVRDPYIDVRSYGAVGDGVTDDTTAISNAIAALPTTPDEAKGGTIYFPTGTYLISSSITISKPCVSLKGIGLRPGWGFATSTIKADTNFNSSSSAPMIIFTNASDPSSVEGLYIDGSDDSYVSVGIEIQCPSHPSTIKDVVVRNVGSGIGINITSDTGGSKSQSVYFERLGLDNCQTGVSIPGYTNHIIFNQCILGGENNAVIIGDTSDLTKSIHFTQCEFYLEAGGTPDNAVTIKYAVTVTFNQCWIEAVSSISTVNELIQIGVSGGQADNISIVHCMLNGNSKANYAIDVVNGDKNYICGNWEYGINTDFLKITDATHRTGHILIHNPGYAHDITHGTGALNCYSRVMSVANIETGLRIKRNQSGGSYNDEWVWYMPATSTDFRLWNGSDIIDCDSSGNVWIKLDCSALTFTDRTPYPRDIKTAYDAICSVQSTKDGNVDHAKLHKFIKEKDGRNLSKLVSAQNEVIKNLIERIERLEK